MYKDMRGVMVRFPYVAGPEMSLEKAEAYMRECDIRHLPLVREDRVVGVVSQRDLLAQKAKENSRRLCLGDIASRYPFVVHQKESLASTVLIMARNKYGSVLIIDEQDHLVGIFTTTDALILLENLLNGDSEFYNKPGAVVQLKDVVAWN